MIELQTKIPKSFQTLANGFHSRNFLAAFADFEVLIYVRCSYSNGDINLEQTVFSVCHNAYIFSIMKNPYYKRHNKLKKNILAKKWK